jgi:chromosome segregation ATPase
MNTPMDPDYAWKEAMRWRNEQIARLQQELRIARHTRIDLEDTVRELQRQLVGARRGAGPPEP